MNRTDAAACHQVSPLQATLAGLCAVLVGIGLARFAYTPLIPALIDAQWFTPAEAAYLGAANLAGYLAGALAAQAMARARSAPSVLRAMMALAAATFFASAMPLSFGWFFVWRFASGFAGGVLMVLAAPTVLPHVPSARRGLASGAIFTGVGLGEDGIDCADTRFAPHGLRVVAGNPLRGTLHDRFLVQDEASQLVPPAVDAKPGERVLDLCAAPGGKTVAICGDMGDRGLLAACDVRARRVALLQDTLRQAGCREARPVYIAPDGALPFASGFDRVLVDAPCSGLGTVRRDPDIKWRRQEGDLAALPGRQLTLLQRAAAVVRPGGRLVYATCSSEPEENEMVVEQFLVGQPAFRLLDLRRDGRAEIAPVLDNRGMLRTLPFAHGLEAFFAAALQRAS